MRFDSANAVCSIVIGRIGRSVVVGFSVVVMVMLNILVNQPDLLKKRVRTRWHPQGQHGQNNNCPKPVHDGILIAHR